MSHSDDLKQRLERASLQWLREQVDIAGFTGTFSVTMSADGVTVDGKGKSKPTTREDKGEQTTEPEESPITDADDTEQADASFLDGRSNDG